jgi:hypothetical protein
LKNLTRDVRLEEAIDLHFVETPAFPAEAHGKHGRYRVAKLIG